MLDQIREPFENDASQLEGEGQGEEEGLEATGCTELNDRVLSCYFAHRDWRKCREEIIAFKACYEDYLARKKAEGR